MATHLHSHIPEIIEHEKHERTASSVWAFLMVLAALGIVIAIALSIR